MKVVRIEHEKLCLTCKQWEPIENMETHGVCAVKREVTEAGNSCPAWAEIEMPEDERWLDYWT